MWPPVREPFLCVKKKTALLPKTVAATMPEKSLSSGSPRPLVTRTARPLCWKQIPQHARGPQAATSPGRPPPQAGVCLWPFAGRTHFEPALRSRGSLLQAHRAASARALLPPNSRLPEGDQDGSLLRTFLNEAHTTDPPRVQLPREARAAPLGPHPQPSSAPRTTPGPLRELPGRRARSTPRFWEWPRRPSRLRCPKPLSEGPRGPCPPWLAALKGPLCGRGGSSHTMPPCHRPPERGPALREEGSNFVAQIW